MLKNNLGYPRVGAHVNLKKPVNNTGQAKSGREELFSVARKICVKNTGNLQKDARHRS